MPHLSQDNLALSFLLLLLLPNTVPAADSNDSTEPSERTNQELNSPPLAEVSQIQELKPRAPVETPPTEYLPYPPPDNYQWPPGENAGNENPHHTSITTPPLIQRNVRDSLISYTEHKTRNRPSEFNPPAGWYTGQSDSGSGSSNTQKSAATSPLRPPIFFRLLASSLSTNARPRISRPHVLPSQLDSQHPTFAPSNEWPPDAVPSVEQTTSSTTTTESDFAPPPSWPLLTRLMVSFLPDPARSAVIPRVPVETPPTEYLPYPPPPNYAWPSGQSAGNENPQPSEFDSPGGWYGGTGQGQNQGGQGQGSGIASPQNSGGVVAAGGGKSTNLSPGAIAGIAIAGAVFLALVMFFLWRRRKINRRKKEEAGGGGDEPGSAPPMSEHDE